MPTPLNKIETNEVSDAPMSDDDRVKRILADMNAGPEEQSQPPQQDEAPGRQTPPQYEYQPDQQMAMPPHMMNNGHPMMGRPMPQQMMMMQQAPPQYEEPASAPEPAPPVPAKKNVFAHITDVLKLPVVVALVFLLLSLPVVDLYLSRYAHWAFSAGGNLSIAGLAVKALAAGLIMGVYDTIDKLVSRLF